MNSTPAPQYVNVAPARRLISKPRDLVSHVEGRHVAILVCRFGERMFQDEKEPTPIAEVVVVDVEADPPHLLAELTISWRRVVRALRLGDPGTWQIGRLVREEEYQAVELLEPEEGFDLDRVAGSLAELEAARTDRLGQLSLQVTHEEIDEPSGRSARSA